MGKQIQAGIRVAGLAALVIAGACRNDHSPAKRALGAGCTVNSDCEGSLVCSFDRCHVECNTSEDCDSGARCVKTEDRVGVCQLDEDQACHYTSECPVPLVCASDLECRNECQTERDCLPGQECAAERVCAEPDEMDDAGNLIGGDPVGGGGAGNTGSTGGTAGAGTGGENPGSGGAGGTGGTGGTAGAGTGGENPGSGGVGGTGGNTAGTGGASSGGGGAGGASGGAAGSGAGGAPGGGVTTSIAGRGGGGGREPTSVAGQGGAGGVGDGIPTGCGVLTTTRYFCEDFEDGLGLWTVSGQDWDLIVSDFRSPTHAATDSPDGNYLCGSDTSMYLKAPLDLTGAVTPVLEFWHKLSHDGRSADEGAFVEFSADGITWDVSMRLTTYTTTWSLQRLSLSQFVGSQQYVRFSLRETGGCGVADGWYLDDIEVRELD